MGSSPPEPLPKETDLCTATLYQESQTTDPLRKYLEHRSPFDVKTLTDVQANSRRLNPSPKRLTDPSSTLTLGKQNQKDLLQNGTGRAGGPTAPSARFSQVVPHIQAPPSRQGSRHKSQIELQFKNIAISHECFVKIRKEAPSTCYQMKEKIGQGTFGEVFRAVHRKTQEQRAIKVLKAKLMKEARRKEFLAEMTLLSRLNHPSIITLYELFSHNGKYYVVMEYCQGGSMMEILDGLRSQQGGQITHEGQIANIARQLLSALAYMHSQDIIHRDIKLDNLVFLQAQQRIAIKLIDFGTAVHAPHRPITGYPVAGTLSYLAPQVLGEVLTEKSDVWSSGVLLYILLTGSSPFRGKQESETRRNILKAALKFDQPPLRDLSQDAKDLLKRMLTSDPNKRISALEALHHRWIGAESRQPLQEANLAQLWAHERRNNLVAVIQSFLALRKISQQQRQQLADMFTAMDSDGNGVISREELLSTFRQLSGSHSEEEIEAVARSVDINDSGKIDFNEFIIAMYDRQKLYLRESLGQAFQHFDVDHTGFIELEELKEMLKGGDKAEVEYFFHLIDTDSDHKISRQEFLDYLLKE